MVNTGLRTYYWDDLVTLLHGDARHLLAPEDPPAGVDLIVTDPPYARADLPLWRLLYELAEALLKPGGWLISYSGTAFLPEVHEALRGPALRYAWCGAVVHPGGGQMLTVDDLTVLHEWKPILVYRRQPAGTQRGAGGRYVAGARTGFRDVLQRGNRDKRHHDWGQPVSESVELLRRFGRPGQVVLDPFAGAGTTLVAAKALGMHAVGVEIDEDHCQRAAQRCAQEVLALAEVPTALTPVQLRMPA